MDYQLAQTIVSLHQRLQVASSDNKVLQKKVSDLELEVSYIRSHKDGLDHALHRVLKQGAQNATHHGTVTSELSYLKQDNARLRHKIQGVYHNAVTLRDRHCEEVKVFTDCVMRDLPPDDAATLYSEYCHDDWKFWEQPAELAPSTSSVDAALTGQRQTYRTDGQFAQSDDAALTWAERIMAGTTQPKEDWLAPLDIRNNCMTTDATIHTDWISDQDLAAAKCLVSLDVDPRKIMTQNLGSEKVSGVMEEDNSARYDMGWEDAAMNGRVVPTDDDWSKTTQSSSSQRP